MFRIRSLAAAAALLLVGTAGLSAQAPTWEQVRTRYIAAMGGRAAIEAQQGRTIYGKVEVAAQGISAPITIWSAPPSRFVSHVSIPGMGDSRSGFDGETGWSDNPAMGQMLLEGRGLEQMKQQADFHGVLHPDKYLASATVTGEKQFEGKACWEVKLTTTWGEEYTEYYDKETGLGHGSVRSQESPMGAMQATTVTSDYQVHGGVRIPTVITVKVMGIAQVVKVDSVKVGPVPASVFELPASIKALKKP